MTETLKLHPSAYGIRFTVPICPRGHDKRLTGIYEDRRCRECLKTNNAERTRIKKNYVPKERMRDVAINWEDLIGDIPRFSTRSFCEGCRRYRLKPTNYPLCGTCLMARSTGREVPSRKGEK